MTFLPQISYVFKPVAQFRINEIGFEAKDIHVTPCIACHIQVEKKSRHQDKPTCSTYSCKWKTKEKEQPYGFDFAFVISHVAIIVSSLSCLLWKPGFSSVPPVTRSTIHVTPRNQQNHPPSVPYVPLAFGLHAGNEPIPSLYIPSTTPIVMLLLEKCPSRPALEKLNGIGTVSCKYVYSYYTLHYKVKCFGFIKAIIEAYIKYLQ